eukprot:scaffold38659_cov31-Phaeocystis_antarctica.AAC.1
MASTGAGGPDGSGEADGRLLTARSTGSHCGGHATAIFARGKACCILWKEKCSTRGTASCLFRSRVARISKVVTTTLRFAVTGRCSREIPPRAGCNCERTVDKVAVITLVATRNP